MAQPAHCLQHVVGDGRHESLTVHLPQSSSCLVQAHTSSDIGYNKQALVSRYYSALPGNFCRKSDHFRLTYAMLDRGSAGGIGELPDIRSVHCGTNCGINGKRSGKSCVILSPRTPANKRCYGIVHIQGSSSRGINRLGTLHFFGRRLHGKPSTVSQKEPWPAVFGSRLNRGGPFRHVKHWHTLQQSA